MTTRHDVQSTLWRYSLAAGSFVPPRFAANDYAQNTQAQGKGGLWRQLTQFLLAEDASAAQRERQRAVLVRRAKQQVSAQKSGQANSQIKGYSGAVLATTATFQRSSHLPYDDYLGKPLIEHSLASLEHTYERFVIADEDSLLATENSPIDVARYPELLASGRALSGLHSALSFAFQDWVAVVAYDMPYVSSYYWDYLFAKRGGAPIVIAQDARGEFAPLAALYHRSVIMQVAHLLEHSQGDIEELLSVCGATVIAWESLEVRFGRQLFTPAVAVGQPPL